MYIIYFAVLFNQIIKQCCHTRGSYGRGRWCSRAAAATSRQYTVHSCMPLEIFKVQVKACANCWSGAGAILDCALVVVSCAACPFLWQAWGNPFGLGGLSQLLVARAGDQSHLTSMCRFGGNCRVTRELLLVFDIFHEASLRKSCFLTSQRYL